MCVVSTVMDQWTNPTSPNSIPWTINTPTPDDAKLMLEIIEKLDKLDKRMDNLECLIEESIKEEYIEKLKKRSRGEE